jgi:hypothetical protein
MKFMIFFDNARARWFSFVLRNMLAKALRRKVFILVFNELPPALAGVIM